MWKRLKHPNVVSLLGITATPLQLVLDTSGRDIPDYMRETTDPDRPRLVCSFLCLYFYPTLTPPPAV